MFWRHAQARACTLLFSTRGMLPSLSGFLGYGYNRVQARGGKGGIIDRIYCSLPSWCATMVSANATTKTDPRQMHIKKVSDHAPVELSICAASAKSCGA